MIKVLWAISVLMSFEISRAACSDQVAAVQQVYNTCGSINGNWGCGQYAWGSPQVVAWYEPGAIYYACRSYHCVYVDSYFTHARSGISESCYPEVTTNTTSAPVDAPKRSCGSVVEHENRALGEWIPIVGTSISLNYFTKWVQGRSADYTLQTKVDATYNSASIPSIEVIIRDDAGSIASSISMPNAANQSSSFLWNGLNASSQETWGRRKFTVEQFLVLSSGSQSPTTSTVYAGSLKSKKLGLGAWVPSQWGFYDVVSSTLFRGDGSTRSGVTATSVSGAYRLPEEDGSLVHYFDSTGRMTETRTGITGQVIATYTYRTDGYLSTFQEAFGRTTTFNYDTSGNFISITAPNGKVTDVTLDSNGYLASVTNPKNETYTMTYGTGGLLATFTKPSSAVSTFNYTSDGLLSTDAHSGGMSIGISQSGASNFAITSAMGRTTNEILTISGLTTTQNETFSDLSSKTTQYSKTSRTSSYKGVTSSESYMNHPRFGALARVPTAYNVTNFGARNSTYSNSATLSVPSDPFSVVSITQVKTMSPTQITNAYTGSTKTWLTTSVMGRTRTEVMDSYERTVSLQLGNQTAMAISYTNDKLTQIQQGSRISTFTYDSTTGLLDTVTNALGQTSSYTYDAAERVSSVTLPDLRVMQFEYDFMGNLIRMTPQSRPDHLFSINAKELVGSYDPPALDLINNFSTSYTYNNDKQLTLVTRPDGATLTNNYNSTTGLLTSYVTPSGTFSWTYNSLKQPQALTAPDGTVMTLSYSNGAQSIARLTSGSTQINRYVRTVGTLAHVASDTAEGTTGSRNIAYTYDNDENLTIAGDISMSYDIPDGKLTGTGFTSLTDSYSYNTFGEITGYQAKQSGSTIYSYSLVRDDLGRISQKTEALNGTTTVIDYTYDVSGRLTQVDRNSVTSATYSYDDNSNRTAGSISGTTTVGTYDDQDRMTAFNVNTYVYNLNGDLQSKTDTLLSQTTTYSYDIFGNIKQVVLPTKTINYDVDQFNRRLSRKVNGALQVRYVFDLKNRLIGEISSAGALTRRYVYGSKSHVPDYFIDSANEKYRIFSDQIGSVRLVVKLSSGTVMQMMEHDEFGRVIQDTNPGYQPFGFAGGLYDWETKLVRFGVRDYDSESGRWTNKDPILFKGNDTNLYGYVMSDPINLIDPSGKYFEDDISRHTTPGQQAVGGLVVTVVAGAVAYHGLTSGNLVGGLIGLGSAAVAVEGFANAIKGIKRTIALLDIDFGFGFNRGPAGEASVIGGGSPGGGGGLPGSGGGLPGGGGGLPGGGGGLPGGGGGLPGGGGGLPGSGGGLPGGGGGLPGSGGC